jgi:hypothetical protein
MNLFKMIQLAISFIIIFTFILIIRWTVLPHLKVFFHGLPPAPLWEGAWNAFIGAGQQIMPFIIAAFLILYLVWKAIHKTVCRIPLIGKPICKLIDRTSPFAELMRAGIFNLFDAIIGIVASRDSMSKRFSRLGQALAGFIEGNFTMAVNTTDEVLGITPLIDKINSSIKIPQSVNLTSTDKNGQPYTDYKQPEPVPNDSPVLTDEQREIDDKYQMCIAQNTIQITPDMSPEDIKFYKNQNQIATTQCKVNKLQTSMAFMSNKYM